MNRRGAKSAKEKRMKMVIYASIIEIVTTLVYPFVLGLTQMRGGCTRDE